MGTGPQGGNKTPQGFANMDKTHTDTTFDAEMPPSMAHAGPDGRQVSQQRRRQETRPSHLQGLGRLCGRGQSQVDNSHRRTCPERYFKERNTSKGAGHTDP